LRALDQQRTIYAEDGYEFGYEERTGGHAPMVEDTADCDHRSPSPFLGTPRQWGPLRIRSEEPTEHDITEAPGGLRISEALGLFPKDLDPAGGSLRVLHGKGNKARTAPLPGDAAEAVNRWLDCRNRRRLTGRHPLFCTLKGEPLWDSYVRELCKRLAAKARIEKRVHPHGLRHGWALGQVQAGTSLNAIQQLLGDRSPHTTSVLSASDRRLSTCLCCAINSSTGYADPSAGERRSSNAGTYRCASAKPPNRTRV
jgi:hypothetical protein